MELASHVPVVTEYKLNIIFSFASFPQRNPTLKEQFAPLAANPSFESRLHRGLLTFFSVRSIFVSLMNTKSSFFTSAKATSENTSFNIHE